MRRHGQPALGGEAVHQVAHGVGDAARLVQHDDPAAHRADGLGHGESQRAAVDQRNGLGADIGHGDQGSRTSQVGPARAAFSVSIMTSIRADLDSLPAYVPGPRDPRRDQAGQQRGVAAADRRSVLAAIAEAAAAGNRYPDLAVTALTARLAEARGVAPDRIAVGCGSVSLCQQLVQITCREPTDEVVYAWRSFEAYPIVTQIGAATACPVPLDAEFRHDMDAMAAAVTPRTRLVMVCSPNNPTGTVVQPAELERFLAAVGPDVLVALDEAYHEYVTEPDAVDGMDLLDAHPNLVVLRTFSKAYRLAALRVGYALGDAGGGVGAAQGVLAVQRQLARAGRGDRRARRRRGAAGVVRRGDHRAGAGPRRAARRGVHGARRPSPTSCGSPSASAPPPSPPTAWSRR